MQAYFGDIVAPSSTSDRLTEEQTYHKQIGGRQMHFNDERFKQSMTDLGTSIGNMFCRNWIGSWDEAMYDPPRGVQFYMPHGIRHEGFGNYWGSVNSWNARKPKNLLDEALKYMLILWVVLSLLFKSAGVIFKFIIALTMAAIWIIVAIGKNIENDKDKAEQLLQTQ